jgi:hypothetical protein
MHKRRRVYKRRAWVYKRQKRNDGVLVGKKKGKRGRKNEKGEE